MHAFNSIIFPFLLCYFIFYSKKNTSCSWYMEYAVGKKIRLCNFTGYESLALQLFKKFFDNLNHLLLKYLCNRQQKPGAILWKNPFIFVIWQKELKLQAYSFFLNSGKLWTIVILKKWPLKYILIKNWKISIGP